MTAYHSDEMVPAALAWVTLSSPAFPPPPPDYSFSSFAAYEHWLREVAPHALREATARLPSLPARMGLGLVALESNAEHDLLNASGQSLVHYSIATSPSGAGDEDADEVADDEAPALDAVGGSPFGDVPPSAWRLHRSRKAKQGRRPAHAGSGPALLPGDGGGASRSRTSPSASRPTYGSTRSG